MMQKIVVMCGCLLLLAACAHQGGMHATSSQVVGKGSYARAERDFRQGKLMEARQQLLAIGKSNPDYDKAQAMLRTTIEPARQRLLRYHRNKAKKEARRRAWFAAWQAWDEAASLSEKTSDRQQADAMLRRLRSERMLMLDKQRKMEDQQLMRWLKAYTPGTSFDANDRIFALLRQQHQAVLDARVEQSLKLARRMQKKSPEIALVLLESAARLQEGSVDEQSLEALRRQVRQELKLKRQRHVKRMAKPRSKKTPSVSLVSIEKLVQSRQWAQAMKYRRQLRRMGDQGAALLARIEQGAADAAAKLYARGREAFANERIDDAVRFWDQAVTLAPDNEEYLDALMRALKVQERLQVIRGQKGQL